MSIIFTGGSGFLGKTFKDYSFNANYLSSKDVDLKDQKSTFEYLFAQKPNCIIHAANKVGGILKNSQCMYEFYHDNLLMNTNVIDYCVKTNTKLVLMSSTCVYPKNANSYPMTENMLHDGLAEETNLGYAFSKRAADIQLWSASKQYGYSNYTIFYLSNLYGKHDHYFSKDSHFVSSFISKILSSENNTIEMYGTGAPLRQFTYSDDIVKITKYFIENNILGSFNISTPENLSIRNMAEIILNKFNIKKELLFNGTLDGVFRKDVSSEKLLATMPDFQFTKFSDGIEKLAKDITCFGI
jgi:GDP-L-fucose synthase